MFTRNSAVLLLLEALLVLPYGYSYKASRARLG